MLTDVNSIREFLTLESVLGGQRIEGVVVKPIGYSLFGPDKKALFGKFVSEAFKEVHSKSWREGNTTQGDILERIADAYCSPARWQKAIQRLTEAGKLDGSPRDIGPLILETVADTEKECSDEIRERLYTWAWPHIRRMVTRGLPEWYKEELAKRQFEGRTG